MAKRLSENQKEELIQKFSSGITIEQLSKEFNCTKLTISRNLKKNLGEEEYKGLINKNKSLKSMQEAGISEIDNPLNVDVHNTNVQYKITNTNEVSPFPSFVEIAPLDQEIDNAEQKDLSSVPISDIKFPKVAYMVVYNNIELDIKLLKDYPEWQFLPENDLERKTIEVHYDLKIAKRFCKKEQKVLKIPNTDVFRIVAPNLISKGISRIVTSDKLISL